MLEVDIGISFLELRYSTLRPLISAWQYITLWNLKLMSHMRYIGMILVFSLNSGRGKFQDLPIAVLIGCVVPPFCREPETTF